MAAFGAAFVASDAHVLLSWLHFDSSWLHLGLHFDAPGLFGIAFWCTWVGFGARSDAEGQLSAAQRLHRDAQRLHLPAL